MHHGGSFRLILSWMLLLVLAAACKNLKPGIEVETTRGSIRVGPTPGNEGVITATNVTGSSITINWALATSKSKKTQNFEYFVCSAQSSLANIDTVEECESANKEGSWTENLTSKEFVGLTPSKEYHFNVLVKNSKNRKTLYAGVSARTDSDSTTTGLVSTSPTFTNAERSGTVRHSFYDTVNARHWQFYLDGSTIKSKYSANGSTWLQGSDINTQTVGKFSLHYKLISGTAYVFLVSEEKSFDIFLRRGRLSTTSITWDIAVPVFDGTSSTDLYRSPAVTTDDSNVWVAASKFDGFNWATQVRQSTNTSSGNLSAWDEASTLGSLSTCLRDIALMPRGGEDIYALYQDGIAVTGYSYSGSTWALASTGGGNAWFTTAGIAGMNNAVFAIVISGSDVYVGGAFTDAGGNPNADRIARWNGSSWHALGAGLNGGVNALASSGSDIYVGGNFTDAGGDTNADRIARWNGTSWSALGSV